MMQVCYQTIRLTAPDVSAKSSCDRINGFYGRCCFKIKFMDTEARRGKSFPNAFALVLANCRVHKKVKKSNKSKNFFLASSRPSRSHFQFFFIDIESSRVVAGGGKGNLRPVHWPSAENDRKGSQPLYRRRRKLLRRILFPFAWLT